MRIFKQIEKLDAQMMSVVKKRLRKNALFTIVTSYARLSHVYATLHPALSGGLSVGNTAFLTYMGDFCITAPAQMLG